MDESLPNTPSKSPSRVSKTGTIATIWGENLSTIASQDRVSHMLNHIEPRSVNVAENILTSLQISIYDGREAFIATFMAVTPTIMDPGVAGPAGPAGAGAAEATGAASFTLANIERDIADAIVLPRRSMRKAFDKANKALTESSSGAGAYARTSKKAAAAADAVVADEKTAAAAVVADEKTAAAAKVGDMFDRMMEDTPEGKLKLVEFATYIAAKSEPCQVHDRTACQYAAQLKDYDTYASAVYDAMTGRFIDESARVKLMDLHKQLAGKFQDGITPSRPGAATISQDACRRSAAKMFDIFKKHSIDGGGAVPEAAIMLTMPYAVYKTIKDDDGDGKIQADNDITALLGGNDKPRGFDATSSWGDHQVNWSGAMGSGDAAVQKFDKDKHTIFAFQSTECDFEGVATNNPPKIKSTFTVVDRREGQKDPIKIDCIPLQFGHKTVECVFNPNLASNIALVNKQTVASAPSAPFLCTYMPQVTLNNLSAEDGKKFPKWNDVHNKFIEDCKTKFAASGATFFITASGQRPPGAIPDKITHMGITWVLAACSQGPVSLDATLDKIHLACPNVEARNDGGCAKTPRWVVLSDILEDAIAGSKCAKYIGFTCGGSAKERGDAGKYWDMFWTQKCLRTPCSFWSGDYLAVAATTAPGLAWGIVVNSTVTVWGANVHRTEINGHELRRIREFIQGVHAKAGFLREHPFTLFKSRIKMLLEYLAFTFIREIISLIREPLPGAAPEQHVALDTILILCAALSSITSSVVLKNEQDNFKPEVAVDEGCYSDITPDLFNMFVPADVSSITQAFCTHHGIYDRESYFRKLIPLTRLDDALSNHSGLLWAYDYISDYSPNTLRTKDLAHIYNLHFPMSRGRGGGGGHNLSDSDKRDNIKKTFASVDVLCIAKMIRETKPVSTPPEYSVWLNGLCTSKLDEFLNSKCRDNKFFCDLVRFELPETMGQNRLHAYLQDGPFPAHDFCAQMVIDPGVSFSPPPPPFSVLKMEDSHQSMDVNDSLPPSASQQPPHPSESLPRTGEASKEDTGTNPERFMADLQRVWECSQSDDDTIEPAKRQNIAPFSPPPHVVRNPNQNLGGAAALPSVARRSLFNPTPSSTKHYYEQFVGFLQHEKGEFVGVVRWYMRNAPWGMLVSLDNPITAAMTIMSEYDLKLDDSVKRDPNFSTQSQTAKLELSKLIGRFNEMRPRGGSSTRRRHKLHHNHRRTQYTNKNKRSSRNTKHTTIKHHKSYRKHNHTVKRRKSRRNNRG